MRKVQRKNPRIREINCRLRAGSASGLGKGQGSVRTGAEAGPDGPVWGAGGRPGLAAHIGIAALVVAATVTESFDHWRRRSPGRRSPAHDRRTVQPARTDNLTVPAAVALDATLVAMAVPS